MSRAARRGSRRERRGRWRMIYWRTAPGGGYFESVSGGGLAMRSVSPGASRRRPAGRARRGRRFLLGSGAAWLAQQTAHPDNARMRAAMIHLPESPGIWRKTFDPEG